MGGNNAITLSAAVVLGILAGALPALAAQDRDPGPHEGGGPVQTWCDIDPACNGWNKRHPAPYASSAPAFAAPSKPKHHSSHKQTHD
jgi:hypothetical protein